MHAGTTYELVGPDRRPLAPSASVAACGLAPSAVVNFRPLAGVAMQQRNVPFLSDALLRQARTD